MGSRSTRVDSDDLETLSDFERRDARGQTVSGGSQSDLKRTNSAR